MHVFDERFEQIIIFINDANKNTLNKLGKRSDLATKTMTELVGDSGLFGRLAFLVLKDKNGVISSKYSLLVLVAMKLRVIYEQQL